MEYITPLQLKKIKYTENYLGVDWGVNEGTSKFEADIIMKGIRRYHIPSQKINPTTRPEVSTFEDKPCESSDMNTPKQYSKEQIEEFPDY